jgi:plastocyanin
MTRLSAPFLAALLVLALAACASEVTETAGVSDPTVAGEPSEAPASEEPAAEGEQVRIDGSAFDPSELTVPVGTEVSWVNADTFGHTVTEGTDGNAVDDPIVDEEIAQNGTVGVTFDEPGTYEITCKIHPSMQMTVIVEG